MPLTRLVPSLLLPIALYVGSYAQAAYPTALRAPMAAHSISGSVFTQSEQDQDSQSGITLAANRMSNGNPNLDCGAKIDLANASLGDSHGTITVSRACGMVWSSPVTLSPGHNLRIIEPGVYTFQGIFAEGQNQISGLGPSTVLRLAPQTAYPPRGIAGIRLTDANDRFWAAKDVTVTNLALEGAYRDSVPCRNDLVCASAVVLSGTTTSQVSDVTISHVLFSGWAGLDIRFGNRDFPPSNILITKNIFKECVTQCIESTGFRNNVEISGNQFQGWGVRCPAKCDAIFMYPNLPKVPASDQRDLKITGNTFINLNHATKFATELFGGSNAGARFTNVTYTNNVHDDLNTKGGGSGFSATIFNGVVSKNVWKNGCGSQRCGLELAASGVTVSDNEIHNGTISIGGKDDPGQLFTASNDNVTQNKITISAHNGKGIKVASVSNIVISGNNISMEGSYASCNGIVVGILGGSFGTVNDVRVEQNTLVGGSGPHHPSCSGIRIANSPQHPGSAIVVAHNTLDNFNDGVFDSQDDPSLRDITVDTNLFINTTRPIRLEAPGARMEINGNFSR